MTGILATARASILDRIGDTPLIEVTALAASSGVRLWLKAEAQNPTGSMKDRMALAMIEAAEADGRLQPGQRVVEYTGGSTGVSLAFICAAKNYPLSIITSEAFSVEKRRHMAALGAELTLVESVGGGMDESLTRRMIDKAAEIAHQTGGFQTDQLSNADQLVAYHRMAEEILDQTGGRVDGFIQSTGTAACVRGVSEGLKARGSNARIWAVEPAESAVLSGGPSGVHRIEGVGAGFIVPLWKPELVDHIAQVSTQAAMAMSRRLARELGVFAGSSTGANLVAALEMAQELGPGANIIAPMCDSGMKYLSTPLYADPESGTV